MAGQWPSSFCMFMADWAEMGSRQSGQYLAFLTEKFLVNKRIITWKLFLLSFPVGKMTYPSCHGINCYPCLIDANVHCRFLFLPYHFIKLPQQILVFLKIYLHQVIFCCIVFCCVVSYFDLLRLVMLYLILLCCIVLWCCLLHCIHFKKLCASEYMKTDEWINSLLVHETDLY